MHYTNTATPATVPRRIRACDYLVVAQLFLQSNFLLARALTPEDVKPRLLGHWGTCHGINVAYANLKAFFGDDRNFSFILGPGHGFPALQANLYLDGDLLKVDPQATLDLAGLTCLCRNFSWPAGFPSHSSPATPGVICEGGELGYALATAYGYVLGHPERTTAVLIGDGEFETATTLGSLNLNHLLASPAHGRILPILHLNGYKISGPTLAARKSERELSQLLRGFGYHPIHIYKEEDFLPALRKVAQIFFDRAKYFNARTNTSVGNSPANPANDSAKALPRPYVTSTPSPDTHRHQPYLANPPFLIFHNEKGATGPAQVNNEKVAGNYLAHQIPLKDAKTDPRQLKMLENWLRSYHFSELFNPEKGFTL